MSGRQTPGSVSHADAAAFLAAHGCSGSRTWGNGAGDRYGRHEHDRRKVLFCVSGSIVFHTDDGDLELTAGDRLDLDPRTPHSATVGPRGCRCIEAFCP